MAGSSLSPSQPINLHISRHKPQTFFKYHQIRSQCFAKDGSWANMVDANLGVLRERIAQVRMKERVESCCGRVGRGWSYQSGYDYNHKTSGLMSESVELIGFIAGALGLVFTCGSFFIVLVSIIVHMTESVRLLG